MKRCGRNWMAGPAGKDPWRKRLKPESTIMNHGCGSAESRINPAGQDALSNSATVRVRLSLLMGLCK